VPPPAEQAQEEAGARVPSQRPLQADEIRLAVDHDPFRPDRTRAEAYRMPTDPVEEAPPELPPAPEFRVLGIAENANGGLALMQVEESTPRFINVGESLMGYRLERVAGSMATMVGQGRTLELAVAAPSPQGTPRGRGARGGARGNTQGQRGAADAMAVQQKMIEQLRAQGVSPQMIEQLEQLRAQGAAPQLIDQLMQRLRGMLEATPRVEIRRRPDTMSVPMPDAPRR
jgi:hypothetical protein